MHTLHPRTMQVGRNAHVTALGEVWIDKPAPFDDTYMAFDNTSVGEWAEVLIDDVTGGKYVHINDEVHFIADLLASTWERP